MDLSKINIVYFIGIGGIGMSALARYFNVLGKRVGGYDRTETSLTNALATQGMEINYADDIDSIPSDYTKIENIDEVLVVYTPAIPRTSAQLRYFQMNGFMLFKRSQVLGEISKNYKTLAIGGSHGKTTISAMIAEIFRKSPLGCSAFLGGISKTINSNLIFNLESEWAVMEADEFDRSFLALSPDLLLITSMDPDHLDVYGNAEDMKSSFEAFVNRLETKGVAIIKEGLSLHIPEQKNIQVKYYGLDSARDYFACNIVRDSLYYSFDIMTPGGMMRGFKTAVPGWINIENAVGAAAMCIEAGLSEEFIKKGISSFTGIQRRFDIRIHGKNIIYIDDYAHHPKEISAFIKSIRMLFPDKKMTGIFQPHLFTRTRDFAKDFGIELSMLDNLILLDIYPAREEPIEGVTSQLILDEATLINKQLIRKDDLFNCLEEQDLELLVSMGAGDIDQFIKPIENYLKKYAS